MTKHIVLLAATLFLAQSAWAGLSGQAKPSSDDTAKFQAAAQAFSHGGDLGKARPDLYLLAETNATKDFTDLAAPALVDDTAYAGMVDTLNEALGKIKGGDRDFISYNIARLHLLRARLIRTAAGRQGVLDAAAKAAQAFDPALRDPAAWELKGDIEAARGDAEAAAISYKRISAVGGSPARAQYKTALAYQSANRLTQAEAAYLAAIRAELSGGGGGPELRHLIYQGQASLYLQQGNDPSALVALAQSARVSQDESAPFHLRLDVARRLLQRGRTKEVAAYADAAVRFSPDDEEAKALRDAAKARAGQRTR